MVNYWVYRFIGDYAGLIEDMNQIVARNPAIEIINVQRTNTVVPSYTLNESNYEYLIFTRQEVDDNPDDRRPLRIVRGMEVLDAYLPARVVVDDTGGPYSGWPSVCGSEESDMTLIHQDGFVQEYWGDLSQGQALALAHFIVEKLNERLK